MCGTGGSWWWQCVGGGSNHVSRFYVGDGQGELETEEVAWHRKFLVMWIATFP